MSKHLGKITVSLAVGMGVFALLMLSVYGTKAEPLDSYHSTWQLVRETATEDGANFAAVYNLASNGGNFANKDSSTVASGGPFKIIPGPSEVGTRGKSPGAVWMFAMCGGEAENNTFSFDVVGWAGGNGMAQVVCTGDAVIGTQDVVLYPDDSATATSIWWADTINIDSTATWPGVNSYNNGNNSTSLLLIDTAGLEWLQFVVYDADGSGTEANDVTIYGRPY